MNYTKTEAKDYARENMRGIWAAALNPFRADLSLDEEGLRRNIRHWVDDLGIQGLFVAGKQGEFWAMSLDERKRNMSITVDECGDTAATILSISDQNMNTALELGHYAEECGADYVVVHAPMLSFCHDRGQLLYEYYKRFCDELDIGIAMWSHPDSGYLMQPEECARIAELPNIVAIKYSVPREMYIKLSRMAGDMIQVSTSLEDDWLDNIEELGWRLYLCSSPPYLLQTANDRRMHDYTELGLRGQIRGGAQAARQSRPGSQGDQIHQTRRQADGARKILAAAVGSGWGSCPGAHAGVERPGKGGDPLGV